MTKVERAKKQLQLNRIKVMLEEKELKVLERLEDIERIESSMEELKQNIKDLENKLQGE